jgi:hypothetical protein
MESVQKSRVRYPLKALLMVAGTGLLFFFDLTVGFLFMAMVPPLIPVYVCVLFSAGCLVLSAVQYARRVSVPVPAAMLRSAQHEGKVGERAFAARAA